MKVALGAGTQRWDGWIPTQQEELDLLKPATFAHFFGEARADAFLCEHVWEHLTVEQGRAAARLVSRLPPSRWISARGCAGRPPS